MSYKEVISSSNRCCIRGYQHCWRDLKCLHICSCISAVYLRLPDSAGGRNLASVTIIELLENLYLTNWADTVAFQT